MKRKERVSIRDRRLLEFLLLEDGKTLEEVAKILGISRQALYSEIRKMGIDLKKRNARWFAMHIGVPQLANADWLLQQKGKVTLRGLARKLGVSPTFLKAQIQRLGLDPEDFKRKPSQLVIVHCTWCNALIAVKPSKLKKQKHFFCSKQHLGKWLARNRKTRKAIYDPEIVDEFITTNWQTMTDAEMAEQLGISVETVKKRRQKLGLKRR
jgi:DNA-binding Lrp family transcriptional regulator